MYVSGLAASLSNADQCLSTPVKIAAIISKPILDQCQDFDRHWLAFDIDWGSPAWEGTKYDTKCYQSKPTSWVDVGMSVTP